MVLRALNVPNDLQPMQPDPAAGAHLARGARRSTWCGRARTSCRGCCGACATSPRATSSPPSAPSRCRSRLSPRGRIAQPRPASRSSRRPTRARRSAQSATALAAATLSESTPPAIGIVTTVSAACSARRLRPSPSAPSSSATRSGRSAANSSSATASSASASAARWKPRPLQDAAGLAPLRQPRPRHLEHGAHAHPHAPPVERIGAARRDEHGIGAEAGGAAEDRTDVGVIDDVLEDDDEPRIRDDLGHGRERRAVHRGQRAAVHRVAGQRLGDLGRDDVHRRLGVVREQRGRHRAATSPARARIAARCPAASARPMTFADSAM